MLKTFEGVDSEALTERLYEIRRQERELLVEFLHTLAEVDARKFYLDMAFPSLFAFLTGHLGCSKAAAFRRSTAARLLVRFPEAEAYLADGRLGLTTFVELRDVLEGRAKEVLDRASGRTEEEVKVIVASYQPREAPPDLLRRLPLREKPASCGPEPAAVPATPPPPPRVEPISQELHVLRVTVDREFVRDLDAARAALSHQIPDGNVAKILHEALRRVVRDHERRHAAQTDRPASPRATAPDSRNIPAAARREVWRRDEGCCAHVGIDGRVCRSTHQVQFHHVVPLRAVGSPPSRIFVWPAPHMMPTLPT